MGKHGIHSSCCPVPMNTRIGGLLHADLEQRDMLRVHKLFSA